MATEDDHSIVEKTPEQGEMNETEIDINLEETFSASDPPSWTVGTDHAGNRKLLREKPD